MRLPIQAAAVLRKGTSRTSVAGSLPAAKTASVNCGPGQQLCSCGGNKSVCCDPGQDCHLDGDTNLCVCGAAFLP